jgi:peroxiredoxin
MHRCLPIVAAVVLAAGSSLSQVRADDSSATGPASVAETPIGRQIDNFTLRDYRGKDVALADFADAKVVVVAVLGIECPLVRLYTPRIVELVEEFGPQKVAFIAINPNRQDSLAEMEHFARTNNINFPLLKDAGNAVADRLGAVRTPEMFVLDGERKIRYWGRIDDQYGFQTGVGYQKPRPERRDLAEAIRESLAGQDVSVPVTTAPGCMIGRARSAKPDAEVTYSNQIARIFQSRCLECHREGQIGPFALANYAEVAGWAEMIDEVVTANRMPPWYADPKYGTWANDCRLTEDEKSLIREWVKSGAPEGDPAELPAERAFVDDWRLDREPDLVVYMNEKPFTVPAEGKIEYQHFVVDPGFTEDKYVRAAECMPGARSVVHHIIVYIIPPENEPQPEDLIGVPSRILLAGTAPGNPPTVLPEGMAVRVPAGAKLLFEMHYTAVGREVEDRSAIGLIFSEPEDVQHEAFTGLAINTEFEIPAGAADHEVESWFRFPRDGLLVHLMPHMHLRGKSFRYELVYPDGRTETLLDIPRYDFNWQNSYYFVEPKRVPKGTKMHCIARFDNSPDNLANPDPTQPVRWGEQTWEEMMIGWFAWAPITDRTPASRLRKTAQRDAASDTVTE